VIYVPIIKLFTTLYSLKRGENREREREREIDRERERERETEREREEAGLWRLILTFLKRT
jgi:hypothetical protein